MMLIHLKFCSVFKIANNINTYLQLLYFVLSNTELHKDMHLNIPLW